jgi:hypothetical protein
MQRPQATTQGRIDKSLREYLWEIARLVVGGDGAATTTGAAGEATPTQPPPAETTVMMTAVVNADAAVENALREIKGRVVDVLLDARAAAAVERLVPVLSAAQLGACLLDEVAGRAEDACASSSGSRVVEAMLVRAGVVGLGCDGLGARVCALCDALEAASSWRAAACDINGSHVVRGLLVLLGRAAAAGGGSSSSSSSLREVATTLQRVSAGVVSGLLDETMAEAETETTAVEMLMHQSASPTLQAVLEALAPHPAFVGAVAERIVGVMDSDAAFVRVCCDAVGSRLMETLVTSAPEPVVTALWGSRFAGRLGVLCRDRIGNHVVQRLLASGQCTAATAGAGVLEILPHVRELLLGTSAGVVMQAAEASARHNVLQAELCDAIKKAVTAPVKGKAPEQAASASASASTFAIGLLKTHSPAYIASRTAQALLRMGKDVAKVFAGSLLSLPRDTLVRMAMDPSGSRVVELAMTSSTLPATMRAKASGVLRGRLAEVAMSGSGSGSRVVEKAYAAADVGGKQAMAAELAESEDSLKYDVNGRYVLRACKVQMFREKREAWVTGAKQAARKKELFQEILTDGADDDRATEAGEKGAAKGMSMTAATAVAHTDTLGDHKEFMTKLGFGKMTKVMEPATTKKKKKRKTKAGDEDERKGELPQDETATTATTTKRDEIDDMFHTKKATAKEMEASSKPTTETTTTTTMALANQTTKEQQLSKAVVDTLSNAKQKKKRSKRKQPTEDTTTTTSTGQPPRKKKFTML